MLPVQLRDKAMALAKTDWEGALAIAQGIWDARLACQAVATVARFAPAAQVVPIADKAMRAAALTDDAYTIVEASGWPLQALQERGKAVHLQRHLSRVLALAPQIHPTPSRAWALHNLLRFLSSGERKVWGQVFDEIMKESSNAWHWRTKRVLSDGIQMIAEEDKVYAGQCCASITDEKLRRKIRARIDSIK